MSMQDGIKAVQQAFHNAGESIRWPMYVRQARQFLRQAVEGFDERKYGFASVVDLLRAAGKEGVFRIERDRQGAVRVFPGANLVPKSASMDGLPVDIDEGRTSRCQRNTSPTPPSRSASRASRAPWIRWRCPSRRCRAADMDELSMDGDGDVEDDGPQLGNELHPPPGRARKTKARLAQLAQPRATDPRAAAPPRRRVPAPGRARSRSGRLQTQGHLKVAPTSNTRSPRSRRGATTRRCAPAGRRRRRPGARTRGRRRTSRAGARRLSRRCDGRRSRRRLPP